TLPGRDGDVPVPVARDWPDPQAASTTASAATAPRPAARRQPTAKRPSWRRPGVQERVGDMRIRVAPSSSVEGSTVQEKAARTREAASLTAESATDVTPPIWKKPWIIPS